ncbi:hypothetical protein EJ03DRAFT_59895 [Teratosphaeria nubilosa]|uniref:Mitochondrial protein n=1 Tax=Teratosphaeria nubilosa TaxID=161662 RepID=A0A6G1LCP1_9PEZI|nr:hypothetical protein EJ03DRAFT_59895 [Teratosphaeria nubilosa]
MSKLSNSLKAFINAPHVRPNTTRAPKNIRSVYEKIAQDASSKQVGLPAWLTATTAATMTLNSPQSMLELYGLATSPSIKSSSKLRNHEIWTAELMREIGLKCIGLNGVPRTINTLGEFFSGLPASIQESLKQRKPRRHLTKNAIEQTTERGNKLWESVYRPFSQKLTDKLAQSHPDLPVFIIEGEYGALFSDPPSPSPDIPNVGRVLMSILAVSVLRTQTGVGPQVVSHIFGLRKAYEDGTAEAEEKVEGGEWLAGNEGSEWLLARVDEVVDAIGHNFAQGYGELKAKL